MAFDRASYNFSIKRKLITPAQSFSHFFFTSWPPLAQTTNPEKTKVYKQKEKNQHCGLKLHKIKICVSVQKAGHVSISNALTSIKTMKIRARLKLMGGISGNRRGRERLSAEIINNLSLQSLQLSLNKQCSGLVKHMMCKRQSAECLQNLGTTHIDWFQWLINGIAL